LRASEYTRVKDHHGAFCDDDDIDELMQLLFFLFFFVFVALISLSLSLLSRVKMKIFLNRERESTDFFFGFVPVNF
jgi:hypothetical protein